MKKKSTKRRLFWIEIQYFKPEEFDSPDEPGSGEKYMYSEFVFGLERLRETIGRPLVITSGYRSKAWNAHVGGVAGSAHRLGCAADIKCLTSQTRLELVQAALECGFTRIGIGKTFVHVDTHPTLPQNVMWLY